MLNNQLDQRIDPLSLLIQAIPETRENPELSQRFLQANPTLINSLRKAVLLKSKSLINYNVEKIKRLFLTYLETYGQTPYNAQLPIEYIIDGGDIIVGHYALNDFILVRSGIQTLNSHAILAGSTGSGKTNCTLLILDQIIKIYDFTNVRFIVFAPKLGCAHRNLVINNAAGKAFFLNHKSLKINPFSPIRGVEHNRVISDFARVTATQFGLFVGGQLYLQDCLNSFISQRKDANLIDFVNYVSNITEKSFDYKGYRDCLLIRLKDIMR